MTSITRERIELTVGAGTMHAYAARPDAPGNHPGIIVFQEAFGVNAHMRDVAERFATHGFTAIAPELFHRSAAPGFEGTYGDIDAIMPHMQRLTTEDIADDARAAYGWLERAGCDRIAAVGFCLGGRATYIANAHVKLAAAISFYGGGIAPGLLDLAGKQQAPLLMFWGGLDQHIPAEQYRAVADALTAAKAVHEQVVFSDADHGFFRDVGHTYNAGAAAQAWALLQAFLTSRGAAP